MSTRSTRTALKAKEAFIQYSKKMATRVTVFWMIYRALTSILVFFRPETAAAMTALTEGVDTVMIVNMSVYTGNSATEKIAIAFGKRTRIRSSDDEKNDADESNADDTDEETEETINDD